MLDEAATRRSRLTEPFDLFWQGAAREPTFAEPDYALVHQELKRKGVTLTLLWEEYRQAQLPVLGLLYPLPGVGRQAQTLDAPDPSGRRETVRRLCRADRADCRCLDR